MATPEAYREKIEKVIEIATIVGSKSKELFSSTSPPGKSPRESDIAPSSIAPDDLASEIAASEGGVPPLSVRSRTRRNTAIAMAAAKIATWRARSQSRILDAPDADRATPHQRQAPRTRGERRPSLPRLPDAHCSESRFLADCPCAQSRHPRVWKDSNFRNIEAGGGCCRKTGKGRRCACQGDPVSHTPALKVVDGHCPWQRGLKPVADA